MAISPAAPQQIEFVATHPAPAQHFGTFARLLADQGYSVRLNVAGAAIQLVPNSPSKEPFDLNNVELLAEQCHKAAAVILGLGERFSTDFAKTCREKFPDTRLIVYYENFAGYVAGGYSTTAAETLLYAPEVLFANCNLVDAGIYKEPGVPIDLRGKKRVGLGYYSTEGVSQIRLMREGVAREQKRAEFFAKAQIADQGQELIFFAGGCNENYAQSVFPHFLSSLEALVNAGHDLSWLVFALQQHPRAKLEKQQDGSDFEALRERFAPNLKAPQLVLSPINSTDAQVIASKFCYDQTMMAPEFVMAGIPLARFGLEGKSDCDLVERVEACVTVTTKELLLEFLIRPLQPASDFTLLRARLGMREDWRKRFTDLLQGK